jgi:purine catabolism regulator
VTPPGRTGWDRRTGWLVTAVGARGRDWGRLVVVGEPGGETGAGPGPAGDPAGAAAQGPDGLPHPSTVLLERAAATLALNRLLERDRESLERQTHRTLLSGILTHALTVSEVALRARALGVPLEGRRLVGVMLRPVGGPAPAALEAEARLRDFAETAALAVRERGLTALAGALDDGAVGVLVSLGAADDEGAALDGFAAALDRLLTPHAPAPGAGGQAPGAARPYVMAAGSSVGALRDARRTLLEASQVAEAALHGGSGGGPAGARGGASYYRLPDVRLRGLLHLLRDDARLQTYVERELGPLLAYDAEHGTDLVRILGVYLECGRNKSAAADAAHLSRPSFYDRLHRVERVLGVDLDQVESCLSLHVALLALGAVRR